VGILRPILLTGLRNRITLLDGSQDSLIGSSDKSRMEEKTLRMVIRSGLRAGMQETYNSHCPN
jgi:hypothetical protein